MRSARWAYFGVGFICGNLALLLGEHLQIIVGWNP